jgi:Mn-dependent DtxR family transcriptional regulator
LNEQQRSREDKFRDSWNLEHNKEDILAKKFEEAMKKAKDAPAGKPIRDFDLD